MTDLARIAAVQHTNVAPAARRDDILRLCDEAAEFGFDGVMVQPRWIATCRGRPAGGAVTVCSAMAYPMGGAPTRSKVAEMRHVVEEGAQEVDAMANIGVLASGEPEAFEEELAALVQAAAGVPVRAMLELGALPRALWAEAIRRAEAGGVAWVKNSSGWGEGGKASPEIISFMAAQVTRARVKASGGIRTAADAAAILAAGAGLLGSSAGPAITRGRAGALAY